ncbi:MAG: CheR family methyltransferase, partial [Verrucomicrobiota bacterium]
QSSHDESQSEPLPTLYVGVGASAGGLEPLEQFFGGIPGDSGAAFIVVQHLSPDYESKMDTLLARCTDIVVRQAEDDQLLLPNSVNILPPRHEIAVQGNRLILTEKSRGGAPMSIDHFFESIAKEHLEKSVAVVLSGSGSDGSKGLVEVHQAGGLVISQDPDSARFEAMPTHAIDTGEVDLILEPSEMGTAITDYAKGSTLDTLLERYSRPTDWKQNTFRILDLLRIEHDIDFKLYKPATVRRRIERRLNLLNLNQDAYVDRLASDRDEVTALYQDLLIGVTEFFRDPEAYEFLARRVVPELVATALEERREIRVWVAGCATGEEPYSLAILLREAIADRDISVKIFATDVHRDSIHQAGKAIYLKDNLRHVSEARFERWFEKVPEGYRVVEEIRKVVYFAHHDIIKSAPFTRIDLVTCRNLLIYLRPQTQMRAISLLHFGLRKDGYLFIGPSEHLGEYDHEFDDIDRHWRVFRKRRDVKLINPTPGNPLPLQPATMQPRTDLQTSTRADSAPLRPTDLLPLYDSLLARYMPAAILIDSSGTVLHTFQGAEKFLKVAIGRPSGNLHDSIQDDLRASLRVAIRQVSQSNEPSEFPLIHCRIGDKNLNIRLTVSPAPHRLSLQSSSYMLVLFEETSAKEQKRREASAEAGDAAAMAPVSANTVSERHIRE